VRDTGTLPEEERAKTPGWSPEVIKRIASAVVLAAIALAATFFSPWTFLSLVIVCAGVLVWEWGRLTRGDGLDAIAVTSAVSTAALALLVLAHRPALAALSFAVAGGTVAIITASKQQFGWALAGLAYAALPAAALVWLRGDPALGTAAVIYLFAIAWTTDTASYGAGRLIGGPKLAPRISPRKTWSGFIVGTLAPAFVGMAFALALERGSVVILALVSVGLALACQAGDLSESWVKRRFGAKDMSQLIPGHGGLADRIDGLLFAAATAGLIALRDPENPAAALLIW